MDIERHQKIAILLFLAVWAVLGARYGFRESLDRLAVLGAFLAPILFYRAIAHASGHGFPEILARDYGSPNHPAPYAVFFWMLYLIACAALVFDWSLD